MDDSEVRNNWKDPQTFEMIVTDCMAKAMSLISSSSLYFEPSLLFLISARRTLNTYLKLFSLQPA